MSCGMLTAERMWILWSVSSIKSWRCCCVSASSSRRWWRGFFWKGLHKGRPFCSLCSTLRSKEYRSSRSCRQMRGPAFLRNRCRSSDLYHDRQLRHRKTVRQQTDRYRSWELRPSSGWNHQNAGSAPSNLQTDSRIRSFRKKRPGSALGKNRQSRSS